MGLRVKTLAACAALSLAAACHGAGAHVSSAPSSVRLPLPSEPVAIEPAPDPEPLNLGAPDTQYLVHMATGEVRLFSTSSEASRVLIPHADSAIFQPSLSLLWFRDGARFSVLDIGLSDATPVTLARGVPAVSRFSISRGGADVRTNDSCDLAYMSLDWAHTPRIESILEDAPDLQLENEAWLLAQRERPAGLIGKERGFGAPRVKLPAERGDCEDKRACGSTVSFGATGLQLVLTLERMGGDCMQRACLLRDPKTRLFSTPAKASTWGPATEVIPGSCGPFMFDRARTRFLVARELCSPDAGCTKLAGVALGWVEPGDFVGAPGLGDFDLEE